MRWLAIAAAFACVLPAQEVKKAEEVALRLGDADVAVRRAAVAELVALRPDLAELGDYLLLIVDPPQDQWNSVVGLGGGVGHSMPSLRTLAAGLKSDDAGARVRAVTEICAYGSRASKLQDEVLALSGDPDADVRAAVAKDVARLGWNDRVRESLLRALKDEAAVVRKSAAEALGADREDAGIVAALRGAVQDPDLDVRAEIVRSLGECGEEGRAAASDIVAMLRDREEKVRVAALESVRSLKLKDDRAVREVIRCLDDPDPKVLGAALKAVTRMGEAASASTSRAFELADHDRGPLRCLAIGALWEVAPDRNRGAVVLRTVEALDDPAPAVVQEADSRLRAFARQGTR